MEGYLTFQWGWVFFRWGTSFLSGGGGCPIGGYRFRWGWRFRKTLLNGGRSSKINKPENQKMKVLFRDYWKEKCRKRTRTRFKQDLLKGCRKWIVLKQNVKMLKGNLIIRNKYRWNIEKWILEKLISLTF